MTQEKNELVPPKIRRIIPAECEDHTVNLELNKALATINHFLETRGYPEQRAAFKWMCDHVIFIPVPEKRKNLSMMQLLSQWVKDILDEEAEECARLIEKRSQEIEAAEESGPLIVKPDALFELMTGTDRIRARKGTKRPFV